MTRHDEVFAIFVSANPVLELDREAVEVPDVRSILGTLEPATPSELSTVGSASRIRWGVAAAVFAAVILAVGVSVAVFGGAEPAPPVGPATTIATTPPSTVEPAPTTVTTEAPAATTTTGPAGRQVELDAVGAALEFISAMNAGDIDGVIALSTSDATGLMDRRVHGFLAAFAAAGAPVGVGECAAEPTGDSTAQVRCAVTLGDAVAAELGMAEAIYPLRYEDGLLSWQSFEGIDIGEVNRAYADYLRAFLPEDYSTTCSPFAYDRLQILQSNNLALTPECGALAASVSGDVVAWIREGRPDPPA